VDCGAVKDLAGPDGDEEVVLLGCLDVDGAVFCCDFTEEWEVAE
jgi:hypothetical protein